MGKPSCWRNCFSSGKRLEQISNLLVLVVIEGKREWKGKISGTFINSLLVVFSEKFKSQDVDWSLSLYFNLALDFFSQIFIELCNSPGVSIFMSQFLRLHTPIYSMMNSCVINNKCENKIRIIEICAIYCTFVRDLLKFHLIFPNVQYFHSLLVRWLTSSTDLDGKLLKYPQLSHLDWMRKLLVVKHHNFWNCKEKPIACILRDNFCTRGEG